MLSRIDCHIFRGAEASIDTSSYIALNPTRKPGSLLIAASTAVRESIGSQVACRLALEHFVNGVLSFFEDGRHANQTGSDGVQDEISQEILEAAFKNANAS